MISKKIRREIAKYPLFYQKVWEETAKIPRGETRTYSWIAKRIGCEAGARAVGNALNKNPFPIIIPCHRVVRKDGSIGGFAKGAAEKRRLLEEEKNKNFK